MKQVDLAFGVGRQAFQVLVGDGRGSPVVGLVGLGDIAERHHLRAHLAGALVADPAAVFFVYLVEPDVVVLGRRVDGHRDVDQAEDEGTLPNGAHRIMMDHLRDERHPPVGTGGTIGTKSAQDRWWMEQ